jgi:putative cardiolipin synthase
LNKELKSLPRKLPFYEQDYLYGAPFEKNCEEVSVGEIRVLPLYHNPQFEKKKPLFAAYVTALAWAKKEITIYAPYFVPHDAMVEAMSIALQRGIKIRVITNSIESNDEGFHTLVGMLYKIGGLLKLGMEVRLYKGPHTMHRKGSLWDNKLASFGSDNWDARGHFYQSESVIFTDDKQTIERMQLEIKQDIENSWKLDSDYAKRIWGGTNKVKRFIIKRLLKYL